MRITKTPSLKQSTCKTCGVGLWAVHDRGSTGVRKVDDKPADDGVVRVFHDGLALELDPKDAAVYRQAKVALYHWHKCRPRKRVIPRR